MSAGSGNTNPAGMPGGDETAVTTLYLARHGQSEWNHQSRVTGQLDPALSDIGNEQSRALARCLAGEKLCAVYASTLQRTHATAAPTAAAQSLTIVPLAGLNEIHLGVLQGRQRDERDPAAQALWQQWQADMWGFRVPGGERFDEFAQRVGVALETLLQRHRGERFLVVGHRATNRVVIGSLLGWPRERWAEIRPRNKFFYRIRIGARTDIASIALGGSKAGRYQEGLIM